MSAFTAVLGRELRSRWRLLPASLVLGLVPFTAALAAPRQESSGARWAVAAALAALSSAVLAIALGSSTLAGDLAERRLGFYFSRPLPGWTIWAGKLGAAILSCLATGAVIVLPTYLTTAGVTLGTAIEGPTAAAAWATGILLLVLLAHALGVIGRARSAWTALDLGAAILVGWAAWTMAQSLLRWSYDDALELLALAGLAVLVLSLAGASLSGTLIGRTELRRTHQALSLVLWSALLVAAGVAAVYTTWYLHPAPADLVTVEILGSDRSGRLGFVGGRLGPSRHDLQAAFVVDAASGRVWHPLLGSWEWPSPVTFTEDGREALWLERDADGPGVLVRLDARGQETTTPFALSSPVLAVSPDGGTFAGVDHDRLLVARLPSGPLLASIRDVPAASLRGLRFLDQRHLRVTELEMDGGETQVMVRDIDLASGASTVRAHLAGLAPYPVVLSPQGDRLLAHPRRSGTFELFAVDGGDLLATFAPPPGERLQAIAFLGDGSIAATSGHGRDSHLERFSRDGRVGSPGTELEFAL